MRLIFGAIGRDLRHRLLLVRALFSHQIRMPNAKIQNKQPNRQFEMFLSCCAVFGCAILTRVHRPINRYMLRQEEDGGGGTEEPKRSRRSTKRAIESCVESRNRTWIVCDLECVVLNAVSQFYHLSFVAWVALPRHLASSFASHLCIGESCWWLLRSWALFMPLRSRRNEEATRGAAQCVYSFIYLNCCGLKACITCGWGTMTEINRLE